jgi:hypothetical protein
MVRALLEPAWQIVRLPQSSLVQGVVVIELREVVEVERINVYEPLSVDGRRPHIG